MIFYGFLMSSGWYIYVMTVARVSEDRHISYRLPSRFPSTQSERRSLSSTTICFRCLEADGIISSINLLSQVTHVCASNWTIIGSDNGLSPDRRQAIIWTNAGILLIEPLGTNFSEILIEIQIFSFKKMRLKMSAKWRPFCLGLNVLNIYQ